MAIDSGTRFLGGLGPLGAAALLVGCSTLPAVPGSASAQDGAGDPAGAAPADPAELAELRRAFGNPANSSDDAQVMFEILVAELAGRRGRLDVALEGYLSASRRTDDARVPERAARLAAFAGDWARADTAVRRWLDVAPESVEAMERAGQVALRLGDADAAADRFGALVERADAGAGEPAEGAADAVTVSGDVALERIGALLQSDPDPALAMAVAERLETRFPARAGAALLVARLALARGEEAPARAALDRALQLDPADTGTLLLSARLAAADGDVDAALARLADAVERRPGDRRLRLGQAQLLVEAGRADEARTALLALDGLVGEVDGEGEASGADAAAPPADGLSEVDLRLSMAQLALQAGLLEEAEAWFGALSARGPHTDLARFQRARLRDAATDPEAAIELYEAVAPGEWYVTSQVRAAELRAERGDVQLARERLRALRDGVGDPQLQPRLLTAEGRILQQAGDAQAAVEVLGGGVERFPDDGELRYARALAADAAGQPELLESDLALLIERDPDDAHALNALGYHLAENDVRLDEAEGYLVRALALREDDPAIMDSLGWLRYRQGRRAEAIELLERAYALLPDPEIAAHLGEVLWTDGRRDEARRVWDEALAAAPDHDALGRTVERFTD